MALVRLALGGLLLALVAGLPAGATAQATRRCNAAPAGSESSWAGTGLTSLAREQPKSVERGALPRLWLSPGLTVLRMPHHWVEASARVTALPATWLWVEGSFAYGLPAQRGADARGGMWADGQAGVRLWQKWGEAPWRFVLQACRASNYMPSRWEGTEGAGGSGGLRGSGGPGPLPEAGPTSGMPEPTRLDYVNVHVPVQHALWLDGGVRWGFAVYGASETQTAVRSWAGGLRYSRLTSALLDGQSPLRASFEVWAYMLFRPSGLPAGELAIDRFLLPDKRTDGGSGLGVEAGVRYTPWAFEWAQIELAAGYTPAARDLYLQAGFSFPIWLL